MQIWLVINSPILTMLCSDCSILRDTAGQERFRTIAVSYYRGAMVSVIFLPPLFMLYHPPSTLYIFPLSENVEYMYLEYFQGILVVYDVTNRSSFDNLSEWLDHIKTVSYAYQS